MKTMYVRDHNIDLGTLANPLLGVRNNWLLCKPLSKEGQNLFCVLCLAHDDEISWLIVEGALRAVGLTLIESPDL